MKDWSATESRHHFNHSICGGGGKNREWGGCVAAVWENREQHRSYWTVRTIKYNLGRRSHCVPRNQYDYFKPHRCCSPVWVRMQVKLWWNTHTQTHTLARTVMPSVMWKDRWTADVKKKDVLPPPHLRERLCAHTAHEPRMHTQHKTDAWLWAFKHTHFFFLKFTAQEPCTAFLLPHKQGPSLHALSRKVPTPLCPLTH